MELTENLKGKVIQYKTSLEFFWNAEEQAEFRAWHGHHYGLFGASPSCWNTAIKKAITYYNL